jgi:hypothetical protein
MQAPGFLVWTFQNEEDRGIMSQSSFLCLSLFPMRLHSP